jgi:hypothetical protein
MYSGEFHGWVADLLCNERTGSIPSIVYSIPKWVFYDYPVQSLGVGPDHSRRAHHPQRVG